MPGVVAEAAKNYQIQDQISPATETEMTCGRSVDLPDLRRLAALGFSAVVRYLCRTARGQTASRLLLDLCDGHHERHAAIHYPPGRRVLLSLRRATRLTATS